MLSSSAEGLTGYGAVWDNLVETGLGRGVAKPDITVERTDKE